MKRTIFIWMAAVCCIICRAQVPDNYVSLYEQLIGKSGNALFSELETIAATGYQSHSYADLWTFFNTTDVDENGYIWDMYSDCRFTPITNKCGNYRNVCDCYNREHSLPKSWFGGSDSNAPGTDLFHLVPTDGKVNGQRSNYAFGECSNGTYLTNQARGKLGASTFAGYTNVGTVFEPDDIYKGDFARSYFGMLVRYGTSFAFNQADGGTKMFSNSGAQISASNHYGLTEYSVALLMRWHQLDAVSSKETNRNNAIQQTQGNRNPFIDCPVLAEYLWGNKAGQAVTRADLVSCGCATGGDDTVTALEDTEESVSVLASVTVSAEGKELYLTCLPVGSQVLLFDVQGRLLTRETAASQELSLSCDNNGLYMLVVADQGQTRSIKIAL